MGFAVIRPVLLVLTLLLTSGFEAAAQGRHLRKHTVTEATSLTLVPATKMLAKGRAVIKFSGRYRTITSNGIPTHRVGAFPNAGNPHKIKPQSHKFSVAYIPRKAFRTKKLGMDILMGVAVNGIPFDPMAAEFYLGNHKGWQYNALGGAIPLGLDANYAHVQPSGAYHYHGLPVGLMQELGWQAGRPSPLIGYAADGFPIFAMTAKVDGKVKRMRSSYRLKPGNRPGGRKPSGPHDGSFINDYEYVRGAGDLDACNGVEVTTPDYPNGVYAYFLTRKFPVVPRCLVGKIGKGFKKARR